MAANRNREACVRGAQPGDCLLDIATLLLEVIYLGHDLRRRQLVLEIVGYLLGPNQLSDFRQCDNQQKQLPRLKCEVTHFGSILTICSPRTWKRRGSAIR